MRPSDRLALTVLGAVLLVGGVMTVAAGIAWGEVGTAVLGGAGVVVGAGLVWWVR